jgi:DNA end-binding protein Ku
VLETEVEEESRPRPFWSGLLSFGLVSIPVDLLPAYRSSGGALRMVDADGTPLARRYYCPEDEREVEPEHIVRGYELDNGKVVVVTDEELEALAPKKSREIDLRLFVDRDSIDPLYFARCYFLAPGGAGSGKAYRLLVAVMERSRRAGIASFVMRDKEYLVAIFAEGGLLRAETLRFHDEVRSRQDIGLPKVKRLDAGAVKRMSRAAAALKQDDWDPSKLTDPQAAIVELAERKYKQRKGVVTAAGTARDSGGQVIDLMEVLRKSLAESGITSKGARGARNAQTKSRGKSAKTATATTTRRHSAPRTRQNGATRRRKAPRAGAASAQGH